MADGFVMDTTVSDTSAVDASVGDAFVVIEHAVVSCVAAPGTDVSSDCSTRKPASRLLSSWITLSTIARGLGVLAQRLSEGTNETGNMQAGGKYTYMSAPDANEGIWAALRGTSSNERSARRMCLEQADMC